MRLISQLVSPSGVHRLYPVDGEPVIIVPAASMRRPPPPSQVATIAPVHRAVFNANRVNFSEEMLFQKTEKNAGSLFAKLNRTFVPAFGTTKCTCMGCYVYYQRYYENYLSN